MLATPTQHPAGHSLADARGYRISGASPAALASWENALAVFQRWGGGVDEPLAEALQHAPDFLMAHVLQAYLLVCGRDPRRVRAARPVFAQAARLPANERERMHLAVLAAVLDDDYELARSRLGALLSSHPLDVLALQVAHAFDYMTGDIDRIRERVEAVLPFWTREMPGYHAVLAMYAFGLEECGDYGRADEFARAALELCPLDARAHHVMAHVFEMTARPEEGMQWMGQHAACWSAGTAVARHCWWHVALFALAAERYDLALTLYDRRIRPDRSTEVADLIDGSALLWRIQIHGGEPGQRWAMLAAAWDAHIDDGFCSFNDMHAMLAFAGARDGGRARRLESVLLERQSAPTRHGATTRQLGLAACQGLCAFGDGDYARAVVLLAGLPMVAHRLGGSQAQRDVLFLTLQHAVQRLRRAGTRRAAHPARGSLARVRSDIPEAIV
jgi:tetratricopeptide (TPR) repeat protein